MKVSDYIILSFCLLTIFFILCLVNIYYLEGIPHVPDEVAYLFIAKMFALGNIILPIEVSPDHFNYFPGILTVDTGFWLFQYPFGHSILLALGTIFGVPNLIPPLVGALVVFFIFFITRTIYNDHTSVILLLLPAISPFFLVNAASFMSHNSASLYLVLSVYFLIVYYKNYKKEYSWLLLSGIFLGLLLNTRPLTALPFIFAIFAILVFKKTVGSKLWELTALLFSIGCFLLMWLLYNRITTGDFFTSQYYLINKSHLSLPTSVSVFSDRLENIIIMFNNFSPMLFNWPIAITYIFMFIPFILKRNTFWDNVFLLFIPLLPFVYFFYDDIFIMYGPRFWYEILPFIFLLTARGFSLLYENYKKLTLIVFIVLVIFSYSKWISIFPTEDPDPASPLSLDSLRSFNFTDNRISDLIEDKDIKNALVFVNECASDWWCYGSVFFRNSPRLDTDVVYVKDLGDQRNKEIENYFKNKNLFKVDYNTLELTRIER